MVRVESESRFLGGAGNVASNIVALGGDATIIGVTGRDAFADNLSDLFGSSGIRALLIRLNRPTTVKTRILARRQQMLRLDHECTEPLTSDERTGLIQTIRAEAAQYQVIILSDYGKGLFGDAFMADFNSVIRSLPHSPSILVDPKPQHFPYYADSTLLTPNL